VKEIEAQEGRTFVHPFEGPRTVLDQLLTLFRGRQGGIAHGAAVVKVLRLPGKRGRTMR
jgi:hypothetical protein